MKKRIFLTFTLLAALALSLFLASRVSKAIIRPINEIDLEHPEEGDTYEELAPLLGRIAAQNRQIRAQIDEMKTKQQEFATITENMNEGLLVIDQETEVLSYNNAALRLLGASKVEGSVFSLNRSEQFRHAVDQALHGQHSFDLMELSDRTYQLIANPVYEHGKVVGAVAIFRDRREVTQMAEDLTGVQHMVEAMRAYTHEFMNKLHVIHGLLQLKKYEMAQTYIMEITKTQQQAVSRVMNQIENPMAAALLVGQTSRAAELGIRLVLDPGSHLSRKDQFLPSAAFVSILGNLITNAMDSLNHAARRDKEITVSIRESEEGLLLCVEDTGPGVDPAVLPHMFENGVSTKGEQRGTGLSIVKELTDLYHGQIRVESHRGVGAAFYVTFHQAMEEAKA